MTLIGNDFSPLDRTIIAILWHFINFLWQIAELVADPWSTFYAGRANMAISLPNIAHSNPRIFPLWESSTTRNSRLLAVCGGPL